MPRDEPPTEKPQEPTLQGLAGDVERLKKQLEEIPVPTAKSGEILVVIVGLIAVTVCVVFVVWLGLRGHIAVRIGEKEGQTISYFLLAVGGVVQLVALRLKALRERSRTLVLEVLGSFGLTLAGIAGVYHRIATSSERWPRWVLAPIALAGLVYLAGDLGMRWRGSRQETAESGQSSCPGRGSA